MHLLLCVTQNRLARWSLSSLLLFALTAQKGVTLCCCLLPRGLVVVQGLQQTVLFCGDGINDLSALAAADVGYAVGATEASVAAAVSTTRCSIAGNLHIASTVPAALMPQICSRTKVLTQAVAFTLHMVCPAPEVLPRYKPGLQSMIASPDCHSTHAEHVH